MYCMKLLFLAMLIAANPVAAVLQTDRPLNHLRTEYDRNMFHFELIPGGCDPKTLVGCDFKLKTFHVGDDLDFQLLITNLSIEAVTVPVRSTMVMNRPELYRDGQLVPFRDGLAEKLETQGIDLAGRMDFAYLEPSKRQKLETIWLKYWYDPFRRGHYKLTVKHRFFGIDEWIESE